MSLRHANLWAAILAFGMAAMPTKAPKPLPSTLPRHRYVGGKLNDRSRFIPAGPRRNVPLTNR